jgi:hypothetical protein
MTRKGVYMFPEYRIVLGMVEEFIESKRSAINVARMKHHERQVLSGLELGIDNPEIREIMREDEDDNNIGNEVDLMVLDCLGVDLLRGYLFVAVYQYVENLLASHCERLGKELNLIPFKEYKEENKINIIEICRKYLTEVAKGNAPSSDLWDTMSVYNKLRNLIVHGEFSSKRYEYKMTAIRKFAKSHPLLEYEEDGDDGMLTLSKGFCEEAINDFEEFLHDLSVK